MAAPPIPISPARPCSRAPRRPQPRRRDPFPLRAARPPSRRRRSSPRPAPSIPPAAPGSRAAAEATAAERPLLTRLAVAAGPIPSHPRRRRQRGGDPGPARRARHPRPVRPQGLRFGRRPRLRRRLGADPPAVIDAGRQTARRRVPPVPLRRCGEAARGRRRAAEASERALLFGAQQLALQHRALWDLLEARQQARALQACAR